MKTILTLMQKIADAIDSDEIDSIDETIEATKIMGILEDTYQEVIDRRTWEFIKDRLLPLEARQAGDPINLLRIPEAVSKIDDIKHYNSTTSQPMSLTYLEPLPFVNFVMQRNPDRDDVDVILSTDGIALYIANDIPPQYYTSFNETTITFDAYETVKGAGNQVADSVIMAHVLPVVDFTDPTATLPIPKRMETLILNEAIATANYRLRQTRDPRSERIASRQHKQLKQLETKTSNDRKVRTYGRRTSSTR